MQGERGDSGRDMRKKRKGAWHMAKGLVAYGPPHGLCNEHFDSILFSCPFSPLTFWPSFQNIFYCLFWKVKLLLEHHTFLC